MRSFILDIPKGSKVFITACKRLLFYFNGKLACVNYGDSAIMLLKYSTKKLVITQSNVGTPLMNTARVVNKVKQLFRDHLKSQKQKILLKGVGFKVIESKLNKSKFLSFRLGFSHPIFVKVPSMIETFVKTSSRIYLVSSDLHSLTTFSAKLAKLKRLDPYKGKGLIFNDNESPLKKSGKT